MLIKGIIIGTIIGLMLGILFTEQAYKLSRYKKKRRIENEDRLFDDYWNA